MLEFEQLSKDAYTIFNQPSD